MALAFAVDIYIDIHQICTRALLEALHHDCNAMRDLIPHIQQCLFTDDLCHQFLFRHIGVGIIVKVVRALHSILAQGIEQFLTVVVCPDAYGVNGIKHTQLLELSLAGFQISRLLDKIGLVDDCNGRAAAAAQSVHQNHFRLIQGTVWLKQHHGDIHIRDGIAGRLVHPLAKLIVGLMHARGVQQNILQGAAGHNAGDAGTGRLGFGGDNGHLLPHQTIGQAGFAHVRAADDRHEHR